MVSGNSLGVIGCGRMATAIVQGLTAAGTKYEPIKLFDTNAQAARVLANSCGGQVTNSMADAVNGAGIVLLAVKPQVIPHIITDLSVMLQSGQLVISIAGGITTHYLERELGQRPAVIRVMPNTPCLVGKGIIAWCSGNYVREEDLQSVNELFAGLGKVLLFAEDQMDAVSALSGCGPAYFLLVAEAMIDAGVELGLTRIMASELVQGTLAGTGVMWELAGEHPVVLKEQVTSPGGSTIAALRVMEERGVRAALINAVSRAMQRTQEIGRSLGKGV